jgi:XrtJ-associated TM-motif-TM protein
MKISRTVLFGCAVMALAAAPLYGQSGCTDSPENPTVALVGGAGALFSGVRLRLKTRGRRASKGSAE